MSAIATATDTSFLLNALTGDLTIRGTVNNGWGDTVVTIVIPAAKLALYAEKSRCLVGEPIPSTQEAPAAQPQANDNASATPTERAGK